MKSEAVHRQLDTRVDLHDQALGMDTRQVAAANGELPQLRTPEPAESTLPDTSSFETYEWFVIFGTRPSKGLTFNMLKQFYRTGEVRDYTLVRTGAMQEWKRAVDIPGLLDHLKYDAKA